MFKMVKRNNLLDGCDPMGHLFDFGGLHEWISDLESTFSNLTGSDVFAQIQPKSSFPKVNVAETEDRYEVTVAIAGYDKDDVELELRENALIINVKTKDEKTGDDKKFLMREISGRSFRRVIRFPLEIDAEQITSYFKDGVLQCNLNKKKSKEKNDTVKIKIT